MKIILVTATLFLSTGLAHAASHREAPMTSVNPNVSLETSDIFSFQPEPRSPLTGLTNPGTNRVGSTGVQSGTAGTGINLSHSYLPSITGN